MCGITGFFQTEFDYTLDAKWEQKITQMKNTLKHRGPDDDSIFMSKHAAFGHTRLSILDLKSGKQPMTRQFMGRYATIIYNGEIYNTKELRADLQKYDLEFSSTGDTELIVNGYLVYGTDVFRRLNGIFSIAIYDHTFDILLLARDHLGVKPLFYTFDEETCVFASEQKAIFAYGIKPEADMDSFKEIFALGPARTPGHGVFKGINEVLPGHFLIVSNPYDINELLSLKNYNPMNYPASKLNPFTLVQPYWKLTGREHSDSYEETVEKVKFLVTDSVKRQMISDIPICTFLSGGLDSSLVSAICSRELKEQGKILNTFSFDFVDNKENFKPNSFQSSLDRPYVDIMVKHIESNHTYLECTNKIQLDYLEKAVDARDLPCMADVESSLLYFCSLVAPVNRVTLTGECADEIFGGYPWFHREELLSKEHFPWGYDMEARGVMLSDDFLASLNMEMYSKNAYLNSISKTPYIDGESDFEKRRREISWLNIQWFMATLLNRMDRTSMYSGLEARVPYADYRILEYVFNIPWHMKCHEGVTKSLLVEVGKDYLPYDVLYRKKSPYPKTYDPMYETMLKSRLLDLLANPNSPICSFVDRKKAVKFITKEYDYGRPWYGQLMSGPQMIAYIIQVNYWMEKYGLSV